MSFSKIYIAYYKAIIKRILFVKENHYSKETESELNNHFAKRVERYLSLCIFLLL